MGIDRVELRRRNHIAPEADALQGAVGHELRLRRVHRACSTRRWKPPTGRASTRARPRAASAASCAAAASAAISRSPAPPSKEMGGIRFEADGTVTILTGTLDYGQGHATPFAQVLADQARHPVRQVPPAAGRFRPAQRRRRHRRLEVDHGERRGLPRGERQADREGQADRRPRARSRRRRHRVRARPLHHRRHRSRHRHPGAGASRLRAG